MPKRPYFLTSEDNPKMFWGYGIPLKDGDKSNLVGMTLVEDGTPTTEAFVESVLCGD